MCVWVSLEQAAQSDDKQNSAAVACCCVAGGTDPLSPACSPGPRPRIDLVSITFENLFLHLRLNTKIIL